MHKVFPETTKIYGDSNDYTVDKPQPFILVPSDVYGDTIYLYDTLYDECDYDMTNPIICTGYACFVDTDSDGEYGWQLCFVDDCGGTHFGDECVLLSNAHRYFDSKSKA